VAAKLHNSIHLQKASFRSIALWLMRLSTLATVRAAGPTGAPALG